MPKFFKIFFSAKYTNPTVILLCLSVAGIFQALGLAALVPLLLTADGKLDASESPINVIIVGLLESVGLEPQFTVLLSLVVGGILLKAFFLVLAYTYVGYAVAEVATHLRERMVKGLLSVNWQYFVKQPLGSIANAMSLEAQRGANAYAMVAKSVSNMILTVVYVGVAFLISWQIAILLVVLGGGMALIMAIFVMIAKRAGGQQTIQTNNLVTELSDMLAGIKPLKAMARHGRFTSLFENQIGSLKRALRNQVIARELPMALEEPLIALSLGLGLLIGTLLWGNPVSELVVVGLLIGLTISSLNHVQKSLVQAVIEESAYYAVHDMIVDIEAHAEPFKANGRTPELLKGCLFDNVSFSYGHRRILNGTDIEVPSGKLTVITGDSGAGKTTIIDLLIGLHRPESGRVLVDQVPLEDLDVQKWRSMVGYVPQELVLFHDTIRNNVTLGDPSYSDEDVCRALEAAGAASFVNALPQGLDSVVGERGMRTSGGQRQRIALARAFVHNPKLLILDEVTSALDPETEQEICENVQSLTSKAGGDLTVLAITHRPAWQDAADKVYHIRA